MKYIGEWCEYPQRYCALIVNNVLQFNTNIASTTDVNIKNEIWVMRSNGEKLCMVKWTTGMSILCLHSNIDMCCYLLLTQCPHCWHLSLCYLNGGKHDDQNLHNKHVDLTRWNIESRVIQTCSIMQHWNTCSLPTPCTR